MGIVQANMPERRAGGIVRGRSLLGLLILWAILLPAVACQSLMPLDTKPLDEAGMAYDSIKELKALRMTAAEVPEIAKVRQSGLSDAHCIELLRIFHLRREAFTAGDAIAAFHQSGVSTDTIMALANMDQVGLGYGDLQAMHLAGLSDAIILEEARHRSAGKPVLSGASLGSMRNFRMNNDILLELVRRGIPDSDAAEILAMHRRGAPDTEILRRFPAS
jgi:hypothetical protein